MKKAVSIAAVLLLAGAAAAAIPRTPPPASGGPTNAAAATNATGKVPLLWQASLGDALAVARTQYQPVFALFTGPNCVWCSRMKAEVLAAPAVHDLLQHFALVEIDAEADPNTAMRFQVRGVPAILLLSSDGEPRLGISGYVAAEDLQQRLRSVLNPQFVQARESAYLDLLKALDSNEVPTNLWPEVMIQLGVPERRAELRGRLGRLTPLPRLAIVNQLADPRLAVRLGAVEMLEEIRGDAAGFDPWIDASSAASNTASLAELGLWAGSAAGAPLSSAYAALTQDEIRSYLQSILSDDRDRSVRALRMLQQGGPDAVAAVAAHLAAHPEMPAGSRNRLREVLYCLCINGRGGLDGASLSRRLLYGTLDLRLKALGDLRRAGSSVIPVVRDFLADPDPIVRETAAETLLDAGRARAIPILREHLATEKDRDVIIAILNDIGGTRNRAGLDLLVSRLQDPSEDIVIAALKGITALKAATAHEDIAARLADPRWRVRVAALDAVAALKLSNHESRVMDLLGDEDAFVRYTAVNTLTAISARRAAPKLEQAFLREADLRGPVAAAYASLDMSLPDSFIKALDGSPAETVLAVLEALKEGSEKDLRLAERYVEDPNPDIGCQAIRLIAMKGMKSPRYRAMLIAVFSGGSREKILVAVEALRIDDDQLPIATGLAEPAADGQVDDIMGAFGVDADAEPTPVPATSVTNAPPPGPASPTEDDIMAAFGGVEAGPASPGEAPSKGASVRDLLEAVESLLAGTQDPEIRFQAALLLIRHRAPSGIAFLESGLSERTVAERLETAENLARFKGKSGLQLLAMLLRDPSPDVRAAAATACLSRDQSGAFIQAVLDELVRPGALLKPHDIYPSRFESAVQEGAGRTIVVDWARKILGGQADPALQNFALMLLERTAKLGDEKVIRRFIRAEDPFQRRAALHALGMVAGKGFTNELEWVSRDPSEYVRAVIPAVYAGHAANWLDHLDLTHFDGAGRSYFYFGDSSAASLQDPVRDALNRLTADESPRIRAEAYLCLLVNREPVDLNQFVRTIEAFPDQAAISERIALFLTQQYQQLGPAFQVLLPYLDRSRQSEEYLARVRTHFKIDGEAVEAEIDVVARAGAPALTATFLDAPVTPSGATNRLQLVYFTTPGCRDCERVERFLATLRRDEPALNIDTYSIRKLAAMQLNEALCDRFGVPEGSRLVAPIVFGGGGYLAGSELSPAGITALVRRSASIPLEDWYVIPDGTLERAAAAIEQRYTHMTAGLVALAGLIDGVNPCAFATIIFLLSYLQVTRRSRREIAQVGLAFVLGVFLAYFALGLGLVELVLRAQAVLSRFRDVLNWALAGFSLVIMVLNLRDGYLCLRGRLQDTVLQLPGGLKDGIHAAIRTGARQARFVVAAFVVGVVVSALELACTGQVYLPTIAFMIQKGENLRGAAAYLLLYNAMFVFPLLVIFGVACFGLTHDRLSRLLQRHAALVKFLTAALFLLLFLVFVLGDRLHAVFARLGGVGA